MIHLFGIRHHGPGSARLLRAQLEQLQPDCLLVEGPPEADGVLPLLAHEQMRPPVALLVYRPDEPNQAVFYPLAVFSPEWQAIRYGLTHHIPVRSMDLPQSIQFRLTADAHPATGEQPATDEGSDAGSGESQPAELFDPFRFLGEASGDGDGERWWERLVEERQSGDVFPAIVEVMTALREEAPKPEGFEARREALREAHMRRTIRAAQREGHERIAVVCGAWHTPALTEFPPAKEDETLLKGLPSAKVEATWVPWTYGRLSTFSGYGAGIRSPGWYHHLWYATGQPGPRWLARVARLLRSEQYDVAPAQVVDAVRLAESLAAIRGRARPGLNELNESVQATYLQGETLPMRLIADKLIVGDRLGSVPDTAPTVPLQQDLTRLQRRLRLAPEATDRVLDLDLRQPNDRERSLLLHRLRVLDIPWGREERVTGKSGTFHELWRLRWEPELSVRIIERAIWGNTVDNAANAYAGHLIERATDLPALTTLLDAVLLADLTNAVQPALERLQAEAAVASDVGHLLAALPPLVRIARYSDVRQTDAGLVLPIISGLVTRIVIGLPGACASLDDDAAEAIVEQIVGANQAMSVLNDPDLLVVWRGTLLRVVDQRGLHGLLAGRLLRLLHDSGALPPEETARRFGFALSPVTPGSAAQPLDADAEVAAAWVEGFLAGSGAILLHDAVLWQMVDDWVRSLPPERFDVILPLVRRTFATFLPAERRQIGERVKRGNNSVPQRAVDDRFDRERANAALMTVATILGVDWSPNPVTPEGDNR